MKIEDIIKFSNGNLIGECDLNKDIVKFSIDSRNIDENTFFIPLKGENSDGHDYIESAFQNGAIGVFTSRDIEARKGKIIIKVSDTLKALQDLARNFRILQSEIPLVAITGSVGKTTTKDMIYSVLSSKYDTLKTLGNYNNDIGMPITLINYNNQEMIVLEMGMNHFGEISFLSNIAKPDVAVITNIGHSHIGNLGSRENILKAKLEILDGMNEEGILIINSDDDMLCNVKDIKQKIITVGFKKEADVYAYNIEVGEDYTIFNVNENEEEYVIKLNTVGEKFIYNALLAWTIGKMYNIPAEDRIKALEKCEFTKMRMNIKKINHMTIIDDCYNASPESMKLALEALSKQEAKRKVAILGDMLELGEYSSKLHEEVGKNVANYNVDKLFVTGKFADSLKFGAMENGMKEEDIIIFSDISEIEDKILNYLKDEDAVLIKASRAMKFEKIVRKIEDAKL